MQHHTNQLALYPAPEAALRDERSLLFLILATLAVVAVMYVYDRAFGPKPPVNGPDPYLEARNLYWQWSYEAPQECQGILGAAERRRCDEHQAQARARFDAEWERKLAAGWVPQEKAGFSCRNATEMSSGRPDHLPPAARVTAG